LAESKNPLCAGGGHMRAEVADEEDANTDLFGN
jgi:hypothetical protein